MQKPNRPNPTDEQLMVAIGQANRQAFEQLYDRYFDKLVWFARGFVDDVQKAEDVVQDVFIRIMEAPDKFDTTKKFSTWVYTLTGNACKNILRNEQNRSRILEQNRTELYPLHTEIPATLDEFHLKQRIKTACEGLNSKERNLYMLRFEQEMNVKEIANVMQIPEGSVKSGLYYMLKKMATHLKDFVHEK